jgi:hypothetical protein
MIPLVGHKLTESVRPEIVAVRQTLHNVVNLRHFFQAIAADICDANKVFQRTNNDKRTTLRFARGGLGKDNLMSRHTRSTLDCFVCLIGVC